MWNTFTDKYACNKDRRQNLLGHYTTVDEATVNRSKNRNAKNMLLFGMNGLKENLKREFLVEKTRSTYTMATTKHNNDNERAILQLDRSIFNLA